MRGGCVHMCVGWQAKGGRNNGEILRAGWLNCEISIKYEKSTPNCLHYFIFTRNHEIFLNKRCERCRFTCTLTEMLQGLLMECSLKVFLLVLKPVCSRICACVFWSLFMVSTEQLCNSCHNGVIGQSHLFAHLPSDLFVFITVRHVGAKLAWSHAMLWDHRLMYCIRYENFPLHVSL